MDEHTIIVLSVSVFLLLTSVFRAKWWWINPPYLAAPRWPKEQENASIGLALAAAAVGLAVGFGGWSLAASYDLDGMAWGFISAFVGLIAARPLCTLVCPELIRAGDETAAKRYAERRTRGSSPPSAR